MESNMSYYTPELSDLFVGYECEALWCCPEHWLKVNIMARDNEVYGELPLSNIHSYELRTPYLTKEQIEVEGWVYHNTLMGEDWLEFKHPKKRLGVSPSADAWFMVIYIPSTTKLLVIMRYVDGFEEETFYDGKCKSINEFRKIIKWIGIKN